MKITAVLRCLWILTVPVFAPFYDAAGQWREVTAGDFAPWNIPGPHYLEYWEYSFVLNDSLLVSYRMSISELGRMHERVTGIRLVIGRPGKPAHVVNKEFPIEKMISEEAAWFVKPNPASAHEISGTPDKGHLVYFRTRKNGHWYHVRLTLSQIRTGVRKPVQGEGFETFPVFLNADVHGFVVINKDSVPVTGKGFLDRGISRQFPLQYLMSVKYLPLNAKQEAISFHIDKPVADRASGASVQVFSDRIQPVDFTKSLTVRGKSGHIPESIRLPETELILENPVVGVPYSMFEQLSPLNRFFAKNIIGRESKEWYGLIRNTQGIALVHIVY